jgi:diguanylate cyclase (GGDEF)-like protein
MLENSPAAWHHENDILTRSGERRLIRWNNSVLRSSSGAVMGVASIGEDVTVQKRAEMGVKRLTRVYAVLSQINALIVRVRDRTELFRETCRIAVEAGAFQMAWIGGIDSKTLDGKVLAWHGGEEGYIDKIKLTAREGTPDSERPACRALRHLQPVICNDIATDSSMSEVREELLKRGHRSVGCFPLTVAGRTEVVIALFAGEANAFDQEEVRLLLELADNISFAVDHIEKQERLNYLAYYDELTGLANRSLFLERVAQYIRSTPAASGKLAVTLIDLERFKNINHSLGRPTGDVLLQRVAKWLIENFGDASLLARVDSDHFAIVFPAVRHEAELARHLERTLEFLLQHPFQVNGDAFHVGAKIGVAMFPDDGADADALLKNAEAALKKAKMSGERYLFYAQRMTDTVVGRFTLEFHLREALDKGEFVLHYQPKVNLLSGKLTGAEALLRWNDPRTGLVPPTKFIPLLEQTGLIYAVGRWVLQSAIDDYLRWRAAGLEVMRIAVNVSPLQLRNRGFIAELKQAVSINDYAAAGLELEITEGVIMEDIGHSIASLRAIRSMGVSVAIDDFGTGFSSLSYLSKLPADTLKIDRSFVNDMMAGTAGRALVSTIIGLAHALELKVVAEGVETEEQANLLRLLNCDEMQGYLCSKPLPCGIFETRYLRRPSTSVSHII